MGGIVKMKASVKRIIWAIGWYFVWILDDFRIFLKGESVSNNIYQFIMLMIWIIPLLLFKDDKERK